MAMTTDSRGRAKNDKRRSFRFPIPARVEIRTGEDLCAAGELINLSRDGAAIRCSDALTPGASYDFHFDKIGAWRGKIVRDLENGGYAVAFENTDREKHQIDRILMDLFDRKGERGQLVTTRARLSAG